MLSKPSCTISTWSLKSSNSTNRLPQRCKPTLSKTQESSRSSRDPSTTSSRSAREVLQTSLSLRCTAEFTPQARRLSVTRVMSKKCISLDKDLLRFTTTRMTSMSRRNQSSISPSSHTLETIRFSITWSRISFLELWLTQVRTRRMVPPNQCLTSFLCASQRPSCKIYATSSLRLPRTSREDPSREDSALWSKRTPIPEDSKKRSTKKRKMITALLFPPTSPNRNLVTPSTMTSSWRTSTQMRSLRTSSPKKKTWRCISTSSTRESISWSTPSRMLTPRCLKWVTRKPSWTRSIWRSSRTRRVGVRIRRRTPSQSCSRKKLVKSHDEHD